MNKWDEATKAMNESEEDPFAPSVPVHVVTGPGSTEPIEIPSDLTQPGSAMDPFALHARTEPELEPAPPRVSIVVVDHFDFTMVAMNSSGATLRVRQLARVEALSLIHKESAKILALSTRGQGMIERELGMQESSIPKVGPGQCLVVMMYLRYNDVRWYLVEYECDGDGVVD